MNLGYAFRRAWRMTWRHRGLWLFGLLASLSSRLRPAMGWTNLPPAVERLVEHVTTSPLAGLIGALLFLLSTVIALGVTYLNALGKSALVDQVYRIENGHHPSRMDGWTAGKAQARSVFLIKLLMGLPIFLLLAVGLIAYLITTRGLSPSLPEPLRPLPSVGASLTCLAPAVCLGTILVIPIHILQRLAVLACVLEMRPPWESVIRGWEVLRNNLGPVLGIGLTVLAVSLGVAAAAGAPCGSLLVALRASQWLAEEVPLGLVLGSTLFFWLTGWFINTILETFRTALWTLAYRQLTGMGRRGEKRVPS